MKKGITDQDLENSFLEEFPDKGYVGTRFKEARTKFGLDRSIIAQVCNVSNPQIHHFETKSSGSMDTLVRYIQYLIKHYHLNPAWIFVPENSNIPLQMEVNRNVLDMIKDLKKALKEEGIAEVTVKQE